MVKRAFLFLLILSKCSILFAQSNNPSKSDYQGTLAEDVSSYLPLKIGNVWTYKSSSTLGTLTTERSIIDTLRDKDGLLWYIYSEYYMVFKRPEKPTISGYYGYKEGTIYVCSSDCNCKNSDRKVPMLKGPLKLNNSWGCKLDARVCSYTLASIDSNKVNSGSIDSVVLVVGHWDDVVDSTWYARGIGLFKKRTHSLNHSSSCDLESYLIKK